MELFLKSLLAHMATNPNLPESLDTLHSMALYESGDYPIGSAEKQALQDTQHLANLMRQVSPDDFRAAIA